MEVRPGAEPFSADRGSTGVLLCHGFTGSPASLRPWGNALVEAGFTVDIPLLPGHGTKWQDLQLTRWPDWYSAVERSLHALTARCDRVFAMGLSMGGALCLRLAEEHPTEVSGLVVVNPSIHSHNKQLWLLPLLRHVLAATPGISNDIKRPGQDEVAYNRVPLQAMASVTGFWQVVAADLPRVLSPILVYASAEDHVVEPCNAQAVLDGVSSTDADYVSLPDSYHVATLDNDAPTIFAGSIEFVRRIAEPLTADSSGTSSP